MLEKDEGRVFQTPDEPMPAVLFVTNSMNAGGAETHILALASALMQEGCFVAVASSGGIFVNELKKRGILHIEAPLNSRMPHHILKSAWILRRAVARYGFDILHAHARLAALACRMVVRGGILAACRPYDSEKNDAVRFVTTAHLDFRVTPLTRRFGYWGERILAVSEDLREYLIREYGLPYDTVDLTVNGIDTDRFYKKQLPVAIERREDKPLEIVHVSRIDKDRAMTAFLLVGLMPTLLKEHRVHLTIVGGGELFLKLSERVERVCRVFGDCITLTGEKEDVLPYLRRADLAVGVSRAALEAMACSLPTVLSGNDGYLGIFTRAQLEVASRSNFCCRGEEKPTEKRLLADLQTLLSADHSLRDALGKEAREVVEEEYSLTRVTKEYLDFYKTLLPYRRKRYNKALILGYHGFGNVGDDALLSHMIKGIRRDDATCGITVLSRDVKRTERDFPVRAVSRYSPYQILRALFSCEVLYVGGGTLLQSGTSHRSLRYYLGIIRLAKRMGKTVVYWSNGIGKLTHREQRKVANCIGTQSILALRDGLSFVKATTLVKEAKDHRASGHEGSAFWKENKKTRFIFESADGAILQSACSQARVAAMLGRARKRAYFVIAPSGTVPKRYQKQYEKNLQSASLLPLEKGLVPIILLMQESKDRAVAERLQAALENKGYSASILTPTPSEAVGIIKGAEFVLSSRLHPLVFAASQGIKAIAYSWDDKTLSFARGVYGEESVLRVSLKEAHRLTEAMLSMLIVKRLPQEILLFTPNEATVSAMKKQAEEMPSLVREALVTTALTRKRESALFSKRMKLEDKP